eukprot:c23440_g1_i1 orf=511-1617(-)
MSQHRTIPHSRSGNTGFTSFFRKLAHFSGNSSSDGLSEQYQSIRNFEESLTHQLGSLKVKENEGILCLDWLDRALGLALGKHKEAESMIPAFRFPLSEFDEKWINEYLDETTKMLDIFNFLTGDISELEHSQLLLGHAVHTLDSCDKGLNKVNVERARISLHDWLRRIRGTHENSSQMRKNERCFTLLQNVADGLKPPKEEAAAKGKGFLYNLYGSRSFTILVCSVLALAFSDKDEIFNIKLHLSCGFLWSTCIINLLQHAKEEASQRIARGSAAGLLELVSMDKSVRKLVAILDIILDEKLPLAKELADQLLFLVQELRNQLDVLSEGVDRVGKKINEFFHTVVANRCALLDHSVQSCNVDSEFHGS